MSRPIFSSVVACRRAASVERQGPGQWMSTAAGLLSSGRLECWRGGVLLTPPVTDQTGQTKMASVGDGAAVAVLYWCCLLEQQKWYRGIKIFFGVLCYLFRYKSIKGDFMPPIPYFFTPSFADLPPKIHRANSSFNRPFWHHNFISTRDHRTKLQT